jgi:hypothetical protein
MVFKSCSAKLVFSKESTTDRGRSTDPIRESRVAHCELAS